MKGIYSEKQVKQPLLKPALVQQIEDAFNQDGLKTLTLNIDADYPAGEQEQIVDLLQRKLLDSSLTKLKISVDSNLNAMALVHDLLEVALQSNLQTLRTIKVSGSVEVTSEKVRDALLGNYFVRDINFPTALFKSALKHVEQRNQTIAKFQAIEKKKFGFSPWGLGIGTGFSAVSYTAFVATGPQVYSMLLSLLGLGGPITGWGIALMPSFAMLGIALGMALPIAIVQLVINVRDYFRKRAFTALPSMQQLLGDDIQVSLTNEQIKRCNHLIEALKRVDPSFNCEALDGDGQARTFQLAPLNARLVMQLVQLSKVLGINAPVTHMSTSSFNSMTDIVRANVDDEEHKAIPRMDRNPQAPLFYSAAQIARNSLSQLTRSLNPARGRYNDADLTLDGRRRLLEQSDITYVDANVAADHIAKGHVAKATVFVDSESLKKIVIACNDNTTMTELTLKFSSVISEEDAKNIAQIIHRNAVHLRKLNLPDAVFVNETAFNCIANALRCNGAITQFNHLPQSKNVERLIAQTLKRNQDMRRETRFMYFGASIGGSVGGVLGMAAIGLWAVVAPAGGITAVMLSVFVPIVALPLAGLIVGLLIALPFALRARSKAIAASHELKAHLSSTMQPADKVEFLMSAQQYRQAMRALSREQKCAPSLRPDFPELIPTLDARLLQKNAEKKEKQDHALFYEDKKAVNKEEIATLNADRVLRTQLSVPRYQFFALTNQVQTLMSDDEDRQKPSQSGSVLKGEALQRVAEAYDDYEDIKALHKQMTTAAC